MPVHDVCVCVEEQASRGAAEDAVEERDRDDRAAILRSLPLAGPPSMARVVAEVATSRREQAAKEEIRKAIEDVTEEANAFAIQKANAENAVQEAAQLAEENAEALAEASGRGDDDADAGDASVRELKKIAEGGRRDAGIEASSGELEQDQSTVASGDGKIERGAGVGGGGRSHSHCEVGRTEDIAGG